MEEEEAQRLIKKFGNKASDVVDEIIKYDSQDRYFWDCVKSKIWKLEHNPPDSQQQNKEN